MGEYNLDPRFRVGVFHQGTLKGRAVYQGMKRVTLTVVAVLLAAPVAANAKGGVIFDRYPDVQAVGSSMSFTVMTMPPRSGLRPLVAFSDEKSARVVRIRATRTDLHGIAYGSVRLPSHGPWDTLITVGGKPVAPSDSEPFRVGVGLTQTIPSADAQRAAASPAPADRHGGGGGTWLWLTSAAAIGSALLVAAMRRRGRWGAA